jgi:16S rRNA processing protein RimM
MSKSFLAVGRIIAPHGVRGEVKVELQTDFPQRFQPGAPIWLEGETEPMHVASVRRQNDFLLVGFDAVPSRTEAELLRERLLVVPRALAMPLPEGEYYSDDLQGLVVTTTDGDELGILVDVWWTNANEVYVVEGAWGEILLPAVAEVVQEVDLQNRRMLVKLLPGLAPPIDALRGASGDAGDL